MKRITIITLILTLTALLAACGGGQTASGNPDPTQNFDVLPTVEAVTAPTLTDADRDVSDDDVYDPVAQGFAIDITGPELLAADLGEQVYSGYTCTITKVGCACEQPIIQKANFDFVSEYSMIYSFNGSGYASEWQMTRLGPNQWSYEIAIYSDEGNLLGAWLVLLTFDVDGYTITEGADLVAGGFVTCPDVAYRRLMSEPTPEN